MSLDIAVAGCSPAGLATALLLHRAGHRVILFERFETPQPIGSGLMLQPTGLAVLNKLGLADDAMARGTRIDRLHGRTAEGRIVLDVHYAALGRSDRFGIGIHRADLFETFFTQARSKAIPIETGCTVTGSVLVGGKRLLQIAGRSDAGPFDLVVDTLGSRSPLAPNVGYALPYGALWTTLDWADLPGFDWAALQQRYRAASKMVGVLPVGTPLDTGRRRLAFFWSIRADQIDAWRDAGLEHWKRDVRTLWPECALLLDQINHADQLTFARYAHRTLPQPAEPALIHIGDAWHSASPQLGQGANMALLDAWALSLALVEDGPLDARLTQAVALRRQHVQLYQWLTALFTPVYQSDSRVLPMIRDRLIGPLSKLWPATRIQAALVSGLVGNPLHRLGLDRETVETGAKL